jgi:hypothetical protein
MRIKLLSVILAGLIVSCRAAAPRFDDDRAFADLVKQCAFGPRHPGARGHRLCLDWMADEFARSAGKIERQLFPFNDPKTGRPFMLTNLIAKFGREPFALFCAHWDSRPWADEDPDPKKRNQPVPAANDGASGVAVLLEIARQLKSNPPARGVSLVLFDGEDSGLQGNDETWCQGARYFASNLNGLRIEYAVLLDMIGDRDLSLPVERNSALMAPQIVDKVWGAAERLGIPAFEKRIRYEIIDDHLELLRVGVPAVDVIDFDYPYWHTTSDTPNKCSPASLGAVGRVLLELIYE